MTRRTTRGRGARVGSARRWARAALLAVALGPGLAASAAAVSASCKEWRAEHSAWKSAVLGAYLGGAPPAELDRALFELLQREAYLTSCDVSVDGARGELVGWRLVGRAPDEYAVAVVESLLDQAGLDLDLRPRIAAAAAAFPTPAVAAAPPEGAPAAGSRVRRGPRGKRPHAGP